MQGAIVIHEVYEEGAAAKDGRLWAGDQILEVMLNHVILNLKYLIQTPHVVARKSVNQPPDGPRSGSFLFLIFTPDSTHSPNICKVKWRYYIVHDHVNL